MAKKNINKNKIKDSADDKIMYFISGLMLVLIMVVVLYPMIYVVSCSISSGIAVSTGQVLLWPVKPTLNGYKLVFSYKSVWVGFKNSFIYLAMNTTFSMVLTILCAYPLSRKEYQGRKVLTVIYTISMLFGAGLIPTYIQFSKMHLTNTRWALLFLGALSTYNMIIVRTYFQHSVPNDLIEAAKIDGCSDFKILLSIVLPLSKSVISVVGLYYAVANWNGYFSAMVYTRDARLAPLQLVLKRILEIASVDLTEIQDPKMIAAALDAAEQLKYAMIVVTSVPVIAMYPLVQKYFRKGVMLGSLKG